MSDKKSDLEDAVSRLDERMIKQETELGAVMNNLDNDTPDNESKMSTIDLNTRLSESQISDCLILDTLIRLGIFPEVDLTRQLKRLSISKNGLGRSEKVQLVQGQREHESGGFLKRMFTRQE